MVRSRGRSAAGGHLSRYGCELRTGCLLRRFHQDRRDIGDPPERGVGGQERDLAGSDSSAFRRSDTVTCM